MLISVRILRHFLAPLVLIALAALIIARNARADAGIPWASVLDADGGSKVTFGVVLGGAEPFDRNPDEAFVPASVTKLFTTGVALDRLGPDYRFETRISWDSLATASQQRITGLTLTGSGDPSWGVAELEEGPRTRLEKIAALLYQKGVREIHGPIRFVSADPRWDDLSVPPGWLAPDLVSCDGALPHAFNVALNCATLVITDLTHAHWKEEGVPTPVQLSLSEGGETAFHVERQGAGYHITGTLKASSGPEVFGLPVPDTAAWAQALLLDAFKESGITVLPAQPGDGSPASSQTLTLVSPPLRDILKPFLKNSINVIGQDLYLASGGAAALQAYLTAHLPAALAQAVSFEDGNGMSHANKITPRAVYALLEELAKSTSFAVVWNALAIAGVDGTLTYRMRGTAAEGVVRGKTGTLTESYNLVGYVPSYNAAGQATAFTPFVVLAHAPSALMGVAHAAQDRVAARLATSANR